MRCFLTTLFLLCISVMLLGQHQNIRIDNGVRNPKEPSIMINPYNTQQIMAGSNRNYYYVSNDGGYTWTSHKLYSQENGVWGDPCIIADTQGSFLYMHLSNPPNGNWIDRIVSQKTMDMGENWVIDSYMGLNGTKAQDKEWAIVNRKNNHIYVTWTEFDEYDSDLSSDSSRIMFSKSIDGGETWSEAKKINQVSGDCIDSDNTTEGAVPAVGPNGEIYVAWAGPAGIVFDKSYDEGETWLDNDIFVAEQVGGWDYDISGIKRCNGLPVTCCDTSKLAYNGTIYVNWSDQRNGEDDTDIWLAKSTDEGETWSEPIRVNDDAPGKQQFFTWMTIDQTNGYLYFVFYDRRNHNGVGTDVYMARSTDGGETFDNFKINDGSFYPNLSFFLGDYTNISAHNNVIRPIWGEVNNFKSKIYTAIIDPTIIGVEEEKIPKASFNVFPNPFSDQINVVFKCKSEYPITITLEDITGKVSEVLLAHQSLPLGKQILTFDSKKFDLSSGIYYLKIVQNHQVEVKKLTYYK